MKKLIVAIVGMAAITLASCNCPFAKSKADKGAEAKPAASETKAPAKK